jgi:cell division GTPase FtsZ
MPETIVKTRSRELVIPTLELESYEPEVQVHPGIADTCTGSLRYGWIGTGQCGGRIVKAFNDLGYGKVLAVNTTNSDMDLLGLADEQKLLMDIGQYGAGKDMRRGENAVRATKQEILHAMENIFGTEVDQIMVCFGAGGGTGGGSAASLIEIARDYGRRIGLGDVNKKVGVVMTLPTRGEANSPQVAANAYQISSEFTQMAADGLISPLIIIDNDKISTMYPKLTVKAFWPTINNTVSGMFDVFNRLSFLPSQYTSFDPVDYQSLITGGGCGIMGLTQINDINDKYAISAAVKNNLTKTLLAGGFDLTTAKGAGCIIVGGRKMMASVEGLQDNIDFAFDVLADITGDATVHRGIYEDSRETLRVYTILGGLNAPTSRIDQLRR